MGTRTVFEIRNSAGELVVTLFSNSSHSMQFAETVFHERLNACAMGPNELAESCVAARYLTGGGNHQAGDRIFWLTSQEDAYGDYDVVVVAKWCSKGKWLVTRTEASELVPVAQGK